jgi:hypothetical protein
VTFSLLFRKREDYSSKRKSIKAEESLKKGLIRSFLLFSI